MKWNINDTKCWEALFKTAQEIPSVQDQLVYIETPPEFASSLEMEIEEAVKDRVWKAGGRYAPRPNRFVIIFFLFFVFCCLLS